MDSLRDEQVRSFPQKTNAKKSILNLKYVFFLSLSAKLFFRPLRRGRRGRDADHAELHNGTDDGGTIGGKIRKLIYLLTCLMDIEEKKFVWEIRGLKQSCVRSVYNHGYHVYDLLVRPLNASFVHVQTLKEPLLHCLDIYLECLPFLKFSASRHSQYFLPFSRLTYS